MARTGDDSDRKRHRSHSHSHKSKHHHKDHDRKSSRHDERHRHDKSTPSKLTEEEERLYEKAKAFVEQQDRGDDRRSGHRDEKRHKKRSRRDDSDDSSDGRERRRHRSDRHKSDRRKDHKRSRRDDHRDHKKSKHHRQDRDEKKHKLDKSTPSADTNLFPLGPTIAQPPTEPLSPTLHYFSHNPHLRLYLYRTHSLHFEDLSSSSARKYFTEFVDAYNSGRLEEAYYEMNLPEEALNQCSRTQHRWKFKVNQVEEEKLNLVRVGVKKQTEYDAKEGGSLPAAKPPAAASHKSDNIDDYEKEQLKAEQRAQQRLLDKRHRQAIRLSHEEMDPHGGKPSTGWERSQEKKRQRSHATHGAHRDREDAISGDLDDDALYGAGGDRGRGETYEKAVAKQRGRRERREAEMEARVEEGKRKEEEKRKEMLAMLGLGNVDAGKKITIAPRRDGV